MPLVLKTNCGLDNSRIIKRHSPRPADQRPLDRRIDRNVVRAMPNHTFQLHGVRPKSVDIVTGRNLPLRNRRRHRPTDRAKIHVLQSRTFTRSGRNEIHHNFQKPARVSRLRVFKRNRLQSGKGVAVLARGHRNRKLTVVGDQTIPRQSGPRRVDKTGIKNN